MFKFAHNYYFAETKISDCEISSISRTQIDTTVQFAVIYGDTGLKVIFNTSRTLVLSFYCCFSTYVWQHLEIPDSFRTSPHIQFIPYKRKMCLKLLIKFSL